jgi:ATP-binding cassette subfamily F protein 3
MALQDFEGAMVLVSHDRHLLRSVTDELLLVHDSTIIPFAGTLDDYPRWLTDQRKVDSCGNENTVSESSSPTRKERRREEAELRRQLQPLRQQAKRLEQNIEHFTNEQSSLQEQMADPSLYEPENKSKLMQLLQEQNRLSTALEEAEEAWLGVCDKLEEKKRSC